MLDNRHLELWKRAVQEYRIIFPCGRVPLDKSFTVEGERLCFWFNTADSTTRIIMDGNGQGQKSSKCASSAEKSHHPGGQESGLPPRT